MRIKKTHESEIGELLSHKMNHNQNNSPAILLKKIAKNCNVKCSFKTDKRKYKCGSVGDSVKSVRVEFDLYNLKYPFQPHVDYAEEIALLMTLALAESFYGY